MFEKLFNRPEATVNTVEEITALKPFFDGKKHHLVFSSSELYMTFCQELFKECGINAFFKNDIAPDGSAAKSENVDVNEVDEDVRDELIEKTGTIIDRDRPMINFKMDANHAKDGSDAWDVNFKVDKELQNYWDPNVEVLPEPGETDTPVEADPFDGDDSDCDEEV